MGHIVLQDDKHNGGEGNHPKQFVTKLRSGSDIRGPIARIDKTDRNKQPRSDVLEDIKSTKTGFVITPAKIFNEIEQQDF
jgi:hypothetical protein